MLVREDINDVLKPKTEDDINDAIYLRIQELGDMEIEDMLESISEEFKLDQCAVSQMFIANIEPKERKEIIELIYNTLHEYNRI